MSFELLPGSVVESGPHVGLVSYPLLDGTPTVWHLSRAFGGARTPLDPAHFGFITGIRDLPPTPHIAAERIARASQFDGARYHLIEQNCEHPIQYAVTGVSESPTVKGLALLGVIAACVFGVRALKG